ncbi:MAG TPA: hypothetical protein VN408_15155 [Actinoplanes sp.]|nr:hypothetical protein [Actinoplanes sp.]
MTSASSFTTLAGAAMKSTSSPDLHGTPEGKLVYERDFYEKDVEAFGYFQNVHVYDVAAMCDAEITKVLRSPGPSSVASASAPVPGGLN